VFTAKPIQHQFLWFSTFLPIFSRLNLPGNILSLRLYRPCGHRYDTSGYVNKRICLSVPPTCLNLDIQCHWLAEGAFTPSLSKPRQLSFVKPLHAAVGKNAFASSPVNDAPRCRSKSVATSFPRLCASFDTRIRGPTKLTRAGYCFKCAMNSHTNNRVLPLLGYPIRRSPG
jgi:hypothetical protein